MYNFILSCVDTDSITFSKPDKTPFTEDEYMNILNDLNKQLPTQVQLAFEDQFKKIIVLKAKNYIYRMSDDKVVLKGSSLKSSTLEPAIKTFINDIIDYLLNTENINNNDIIDIYNKHIRLSQNITDIKTWASKKTLSATTFSSERPNETKIIQAIQGTDYVEGDKVWTFFKEDGSLELIERFNGDYDKSVMTEKLYKATSRFWTILDKNIFINYSLKKNKYHLELLCGNISPGEFDELTKLKVKKPKKTKND